MRKTRFSFSLSPKMLMSSHATQKWHSPRFGAIRALSQSDGVIINTVNYYHYNHYGKWRARWLMFLALLPPFCLVTFLCCMLFGWRIFHVKVYGLLAYTNKELAFVSLPWLANIELDFTCQFSMLAKTTTGGLCKMTLLSFISEKGVYEFQKIKDCPAPTR